MNTLGPTKGMPPLFAAALASSVTSDGGSEGMTRPAND